MAFAFAALPAAGPPVLEYLVAPEIRPSGVSCAPRRALMRMFPTLANLCPQRIFESMFAMCLSACIVSTPLSAFVLPGPMLSAQCRQAKFHQADCRQAKCCACCTSSLQTIAEGVELSSGAYTQPAHSLLTGSEKPRLRANEKRYFTPKDASVPIPSSSSRKGSSEAADPPPAATAGASTLGDGLGDDEAGCREVLQLLPPPSPPRDGPSKKQRQAKVAAALQRIHSILKVAPFNTEGGSFHC